MAANAAELPENQEASAAAETINDALTELGGDSGSNAAILEAQPTATGFETVDETAFVDIGSNPTDGVSVDFHDNSEGLTIGLPQLDGIEDATQADDGTVVYPTGEDATVAVQALDGGVRLTTVMESAAAPTEFDYALDVPEGVELVENPDGSIAILAPTEIEVPLPGETERVSAAATEILGVTELTLEDLDNLTDEQIELLAAIPEEQTETHIEVTQIAEISAPWAIDAAGSLLPTSYDLENGVLTQIIEIDGDTQFPVVADPSAWWWTATSVACVASIALTFSPAKVAQIGRSITRFATSAPVIATAVRALGGAAKAVVAVAKHSMNKLKAAGGNSWWAKRLPSYPMSTATRNSANRITSWAGNNIWEVMGLGSCGSLIREATR